jgi:DNA-binding NarL/FixJ family response regulator
MPLEERGDMALARILLAEDHQGILDSVTQLLEGEFEVVAVAKDGQRATEAVAELDPDVVLLDVSLPILNGIEAASRIKNSGFTGKIVFLTIYEDPDFVAAAFSAGASGYVFKTRLASDLIPIIRQLSLNGVHPLRSPGFNRQGGT